MPRDDEKKNGSRRPAGETHDPWWADDGPNERPLPEGFPERPDITKVEKLRQRLSQDRAARKTPSRSRLASRFNEKTAKQFKEIGSYTMIPSIMLAGPAVGYALGWLLERQFGGKPWVSVFGILFGMVAAFRQIILLLKKNSQKK